MVSKQHIRQLSDHLISQIAAGEVVERPASVVKELVENALDAGAGQIVVTLERGGSELIEVRDDGEGMSPEDLQAAFGRHATSKIECFEDLERVATLGFRGEALAAIAAVARVEASSALEPGEGHRLSIDGGTRGEVEPTSRPRGTTLEVRSLFFNVPARRKFLKRPTTEMRRALEVIQGYALAHPEVGFVVRHDGREVLEAPVVGTGGAARLERIAQLFGRELAEHLVALPDDALASGFVGDRETTRGRRLFVFVNGRLLRDRAILAVFYRAVRDLWHGEQMPALFLFLDVPPHEVDVNVHPQKAEVRFRDGAIVGQVASVLRRGLEEARGDEPIALTEIDPGSRPAALAWQSSQGEPRSHGSQPGLLAEGAPAGASWPTGGTTGGRSGDQQRLAEVSYEPWKSTSSVLSGRGKSERALRVLGQYKGSLILVEGPDGLYVIDQHAAHERVLYESYRAALDEEETPMQPLLEPRLLEVSPAEAEAVEQWSDAFRAMGFDAAMMSGGSVALSGVPASLGQEAAERAFLALVGTEARSGSDSPAELKSRMLDSLAADKACRSAVRIHHPLALEKMERLIEDLFAAEQPYACPHGRPTVLKLGDGELERRFGRQGWRSGREQPEATP